MLAVSLLAGAAVVGGAMPWRRRIVRWLSSNLPERLGESRLPIQVGGMAAATIMAASLAFFGGAGGPIAILSGGGGLPTIPPAATPSAPNTPAIDVTVVDTSTWWVDFSAFAGSGSDTQDSIAVTVLRSGAADTLFHAVSGVQTRDTVSDNADLKADTTYRVLGRQKGVAGGWSIADTLVVVNAADNPFMEDDFSSYSALSELLNDENGIYSEGEFFCTNGCSYGEAGSINLDTDTVYPGLTQSLRMDYSGGTSGGAGRLAITPSFPADKAQVWLEAAVKFGAGFTIEAATPGGGAGLKFIFLRVYESEVPEGGRFALEFGNGDAGTLDMYGPNDDIQASYVEGTSTLNSLVDNDWHVVRFYVNAPADSMRFWIDGVSEAVSASFNTDAQVVYGAYIGQHMNKDVPAQSYWWGYWKAYDTDPGW